MCCMCSLCMHVLAIDIVFNFFIIATIRDVICWQCIHTYKKLKQTCFKFNLNAHVLSGCIFRRNVQNAAWSVSPWSPCTVTIIII